MGCCSGQVTRSGADEKSYRIAYTVDHFFYFRAYTNVGEGYDVALLTVRKPMTFDRFRSSLPLCGVGETSADKRVFTIGFGLTDSETRARPQNLMVRYSLLAPTLTFRKMRLPTSETFGRPTVGSIHLSYDFCVGIPCTHFPTKCI